jgi:glycosyltransferase involved in cell wall biosynthesis
MKKWYCSVFKKQEVMDTIRESIKILNMRNYTLLFFNPLYVDLMGNIDEKSCVFDSIENWLKHPQLAYAKKYIEMAYDRIRNRADYITTVSKAMKDYFGKDRERVYHISNGVDIDSFETECNHVKPKDLQLIPGPIIGYAGKIQSRIDVELVRYLTNTISGCSFVFIGQEIDPATAKMIRSCKNTYYLGDKHYSQLPAYLKYFDVCIIPHKVTELTASMDPLKLYEYIAAGKPVVTSMVGGVERFSDVVSVAKSKEEFAAGIMKSLENEDEQKRRKCIQILRDEFSWKRKTEEIIKIISTVMDKRK